MLLGRQRQGHGHARVVELGVVVDHAGLQPFPLEHREAPQGFLAADHVAVPEAFPARQHVVEEQAGVDVGHLHPGVERRDQSQRVGQVRRVLQQDPPFEQTFLDQVVLGAVQLLHRHFQIAHPPVHQLGAAAAGAFGDVVLLDQGDLQAPAGRVGGDPAAGRPGAYHQQVIADLLP